MTKRQQAPAWPDAEGGCVGSEFDALEPDKAEHPPKHRADWLWVSLWVATAGVALLFFVAWGFAPLVGAAS